VEEEKSLATAWGLTYQRDTGSLCAFDWPDILSFMINLVVNKLYNMKAHSTWGGRSETHVSSKSTNKNVLSVYNEILKHAYSDSDYWYLGGDGYLLDKLYDFDRSDLLELKNDLGNWQFNEMQIFHRALENDYSASHDDLLPIRAYLRGCIMILSDNYEEKHIIARLVDLDDQLLLGEYLNDPQLLAEIKNTLDRIEVLFAGTQPGDENNYYFYTTRLVLIKKAIGSLIKNG